MTQLALEVQHKYRALRKRGFGIVHTHLLLMDEFGVNGDRVLELLKEK